MNPSDDKVPDLLDDRKIGRQSEGEPIVGLFDTDRTSRHVRPATILHALMESAPGDPYDETMEEATPIIEAVAYAQSVLNAEDVFVLNAIDAEGVTFDTLADRLGVSRSQGWRIHARALRRLRALLLNNPTIRERLNMPDTWNAAAMSVLLDIAGYDEGPVEPTRRPFGGWAECVTTQLDDAVNSLVVLGREYDAVRQAQSAAVDAVLYLRSIGRWSLVDFHELICSKHHDYGDGNILTFGMQGVFVRLSDKCERLKNLTRGDIAPRNESLVDTYLDIVGYTVIATMLKAETFELPLDDEFEYVT